MAEHTKPRKNQVPLAEVEQLVAAYQGRLIHYAFRFVHNRQVAEDMVQEAFLRYIRNPLQYGEPPQRVSWLYRVVHNLCIDWLKKESHHSEVHQRLQRQASDTRVPPGVVLLDQWQYLERLMSRLNKKQQQVMLLFYRDGLTYQQIVDITGFSMSNVGMLLFRGLKKMRQMMIADGRTSDG